MSAQTARLCDPPTYVVIGTDETNSGLVSHGELHQTDSPTDIVLDRWRLLAVLPQSSLISIPSPFAYMKLRVFSVSGIAKAIQRGTWRALTAEVVSISIGDINAVVGE
jgi:hypothetical protein